MQIHVDNLTYIIGKDKVIWRYDPIILTDDITIEHHVDNLKINL